VLESNVGVQGIIARIIENVRDQPRIVFGGTNFFLKKLRYKVVKIGECLFSLYF